MSNLEQKIQKTSEISSKTYSEITKKNLENENAIIQNNDTISKIYEKVTNLETIREDVSNVANQILLFKNTLSDQMLKFKEEIKSKIEKNYKD